MTKSRYDNIINLPHHQSEVHPHMSQNDRAAQFASFAALTGFEDEIAETARHVDCKTVHENDELEFLNQQLQYLSQNVDTQIVLTYFVQDEKKQGGTYFTVETTVKKVKKTEQQLVLENATVVPFDDIYKIDIK